MLSSSRVLAHKISQPGFEAAYSIASTMMGSGSTPVSAIRPAKIEMMDGVSTLTASMNSWFCSGVKQSST